MGRLKKILRSLLIVIILSGIFMSFIYAEETTVSVNNSNSTTYKNIPGITEEEIAAIESAKKSNSFFTYGMTMSTECFRNDDNITMGFAAIYCEWLTKLFDIKFKPVIYMWDELMKGVSDHSISFTGEIATEMDGYYRTDSIAERRIKFISAEGAEKLKMLSSGRQLKYGFLEGTNTEAIVGSQIYEDYIAVSVKNYNDAYQKLILGEIDALFMDETAGGMYSQYEKLIIEDFLPVSYNSVSMATKDSSLSAFISVINKYLQSAGSYRIAQMYEEGRSEYLRYYLKKTLTINELDYINEKISAEAPIIVATDPDNYPVCFYNVNENEWQGIAIDILNEISYLTGLTFQYTDPSVSSRSEILSYVYDGKAEMMTNIIGTVAADHNILSANLGYQTDSYAFISSTEFRDVTMSDIPYVRVGLIKDADYTPIFHELVPNHTSVINFNTKAEAVKSLQNGQIDLLMGTRNLLLDLTNYMELTGFKANLLIKRLHEIGFGFNKDETVLRSIVAKTQSLIDVDLIVDEWTRNVFDYSGTLARAQQPFLVGVLVLLVLILILLILMLRYNKRMSSYLEKEVLNRTHELEIQTKAAQVASQAKGDFLARMSHEIRTPLNAIIGMTNIAKQAVIIDKKDTALGEISTASMHLLGILNDVLDMSKIESGKFALSDEVFELSGAMEEVNNIIKQRCTEKNIIFKTDFDLPKINGVYADKLRLKQVLINLLGNAVKFTVDGGTISFDIETNNVDEKFIDVTFRITDSGIGMTEDQMQKLFKAFEQADNTISIKYGGTGLGLAISQNLINQMGGVITVESELNKGSVFQFSLQLTRSELPEDEDTSNLSVSFEGRRILLVEDIEINRIIVLELLSDTMAEIDEAVDGQDALEIFSKSAIGYYDMIFMDIQMPNMNGYEATQAIRKLDRPDAKSVPIIAMTANAYREDIERAKESGMNDHLAKPVDFENLKQTMSHWLK